MQFQLLASAGAVAAAAAAVSMWKSAASATYLVDFYCLRPPSRQVLPPESLAILVLRCPCTGSMTVEGLLMPASIQDLRAPPLRTLLLRHCKHLVL